MSNAMNPSNRPVNVRALVSFVTGFSFLVMFASGLVLYIAPRGRVANFSGWSVLGLDRHAWSHLHMTMAVLLLAGIAWHLYYNFRPLVHYLKQRRATGIGLRLRELVLAIALTALFAAGTLMMWPPFSWVPNWNEQIKNNQEINTGSGQGRQSGSSEAGAAWPSSQSPPQDTRPRYGRQRQ